MARDIEEFLRRAAERRKQQQGKPAARQPAPQPPLQPAPQPPLSQRRSLPSQRKRLVIDENAGLEVIELTQHDIRQGSVSDHVSGHIDTSDIADHATQLGERIVGLHDRIDKRIHDRLDRDLTVLDDSPTVQDDVTAAVVASHVSPIAEELIEMLRTPKSVRHAIILSEILRRPSFDD